MRENTQYITLTAKNFETEVLKSPEPVLVDFWADWCGPCHMIAPVIDELAAEFKDCVKVGKVDVDRNPELSRRFSIRSIPSLLIFKDGQLVDQLIGVVSKKLLVDKLNALIQPA